MQQQKNKPYYGKESDFQKTCCKYLDQMGVLWNHCPNGGSRNPREGASLKAQGVKAGFPDIAIFEPRGAYFGLFIEIKNSKGKMSINQTIWLNRLQDRGYQVHKTNSLDEFIEIVDNYLKIDNNVNYLAAAMRQSTNKIKLDDKR